MTVEYFDGIKNVPLSEWRPNLGTELGGRVSLSMLTGFVPFLSRGIAMRADALAALPWSIRNQSDDDVADCLDCLDAGGGALCDDALTCAAVSCNIDLTQ